jgi:hypothetical protein
MRFPIWWRKRRNVELSEEIQAHLKLAEREAMESGQTQREAQFAARHEFGNVGLAEEVTRDMWGSRWLSDLWQDVRFGFRMLRRSPGFSILAILCLTLGIGANAAVFSWIEGILFRPYPAVAHQERLMALSGMARGETGGTPLSWPDFLDLQRSCTLFDTFFVSKIMGTTLSIGDRAEVTVGSIASANYSGGHDFSRAVTARRLPHPTVLRVRVLTFFQSGRCPFTNFYFLVGRAAFAGSGLLPSRPSLGHDDLTKFQRSGHLSEDGNVEL